MYNTVYYEALEDGTVTGVKPTIGSEVFPCEIQNNTAQLAYMKTEDPSMYVTYDMGDYLNNYTLTLGINIPSGFDQYITVDWGDGMVEILENNLNPNHTYSAIGHYDVVVNFGDGLKKYKIKLQAYYDNLGATTASSANLIAYQPVLVVGNPSVGVQYYTLDNATYPISLTGQIITPG